MSIIRKEQLSNPLSASYASTASYAENAGVSINTGSFVTTSSFNTYTASINNFTSSINTFTASYNTGSFTGSFTGSLLGTSSWAESASQARSASFYQETDPVFVAKSASLATTGSNVFVGNQTITGSLVVTNNFTVLGSASIQYISESTLNIGTNLITVNTNTPSVRFGGLAVIDSGSSPITSASFLYDALQDEFIFVHRGDGTNITSSHFVLGPETYNDQGNEIYLTANRIPKGIGNEHLNDSNISDNGNLVNINSDTNITGSLFITGSQIIFSGSQFEMTNNIIVNPTTRRLNSGSALSVDWGVRGLYSTGNVLSVDWQNRILRVGGNTSVDWANYQLIDNNASQSIAWASRIIYTSNSTIALSWADDITNFSQTYLFRTYSDIQQNSFANISKIQPSGEIIQTNVSGSSLIHNLVALSGSIWVPVNQQLDVSTLMLGIALSTDENNKDTVLLEGDIQFNGVDGPNIQGITTNTQGLPVYIRLGVAEGRMSIIPPTSGYVRIVGHVYYEKTGSFIFKFRPSNDWYKLS